MMAQVIDITLIAIPTGVLELGEAADAHAVEVEAYQIGQYPVTAAQYAIFVAESGHQPPRYWPHGRPHQMFADHPVVDVTWWDALAYCAWLARQTGRPLRLPTEAEWERAARGDARRTYPWGDAFYKDKCNNWENGTGRTTPVDSFPAGVSPFGVMDMAGNVWEWCSSIYRDYPYSAADGREQLTDHSEWRVIRGGSWYDTEWGVRAARRFGSPPTLACHNTGFRLACTL